MRMHMHMHMFTYMDMGMHMYMYMHVCACAWGRAERAGRCPPNLEGGSRQDHLVDIGRSCGACK